MTTKPNIVLVVSDDQGYGDAGCYWDTEVDTPTMDAIAKNGVRYFNSSATRKEQIWNDRISFS